MALPDSLQTVVRKFAAVPDLKLRYSQLLYLARELPSMDSALKTEENLVRGCQSVVHIFVELRDGRVYIQGDSDAQLTKGLVAILVSGFNGATAQEVLDADPQFLAASGLAAALTPARNNGFASALALVKTKVTELMKTATPEPEPSATDDDGTGPIYKSIMKKLSALNPVELNIVDDSHKHAGHAAVKKGSIESHFKIRIVSQAFDNLKLVQRHRMVYELLEEEMAPGKVHAINIDARSPVEVQG